MVNLRPLVLSFVAAGLLAGCASTENYTSTVQSWIGANANQLYRVWGYPNKIQRWQNGNKLAIYRYHNKGRYPKTTYPGATNVVSRNGITEVYTTPAFTTGGGTYSLNCQTWFEINRKNIIVNASNRGNDCAATASYMQHMSNPNKS